MTCFRGGTSETLMLPRLLRHCYCYADSRFSNPMVSGLARYAMKGCSMKRKSIISGTRNSPVSARATTHAPWPKNMQARVEDACRSSLHQLPMCNTVTEQFLAFLSEKTAGDGDWVIALFKNEPAGDETGPPVHGELLFRQATWHTTLLHPFSLCY